MCVNIQWTCSCLKSVMPWVLIFRAYLAIANHWDAPDTSPCRYVQLGKIFRFGCSNPSITLSPSWPSKASSCESYDPACEEPANIFNVLKAFRAYWAEYLQVFVPLEAVHLRWFPLGRKSSWLPRATEVIRPRNSHKLFPNVHENIRNNFVMA